MSDYGFAPALLLLHLMQGFVTEKTTQRTLSLDASTCGERSSGCVTDSFLFSSNGGDFCSSRDIFDAAVAYLARPSAPLILQSTPDVPQLHASGGRMISPALIVIMGADSIPLVEDAASSFVNSWYAAGCRRIVITGGIGRATPDLIKSFEKRTGKIHSTADSKSSRVHLPFAHALGGPDSLPFLHNYSSFSTSWPPALVAQSAHPSAAFSRPFTHDTAALSRYLTEADVYAEILLQALLDSGISAKCLLAIYSSMWLPDAWSCRYSRASFDDQGNLLLQPRLLWHRDVEGDDSVSVWVEPGSTHTGYACQ